jgi:chorismate mutase
MPESPPRSPKSAPSLADIRKQIDGIDDALLDLIMQRAQVVRQVQALKAGVSGPASAMRPAREAEVLRRLEKQFDSSLPLAVIFRIWRELFSAKTRLQGPMSVSVYGADNPIVYWDLARFYFGSATPMQLCDNPGIVWRTVSREAGSIGVLPVPGSADDSVAGNANWWAQLVNAEPHAVQIVARLPFLDDGSGHLPPAFAIGRLDFEPSGDDSTVFIIETRKEVSLAGLQVLITKAGVKAQRIASMDKTDGHGMMRLFVAEGYLGNETTRLLLKTGAGTIEFARIVGGYANPLSRPAAPGEAS